LNTPSDSQAEQLGHVLSRVAPFDPSIERDEDGAIRLKASQYKFVITDHDAMDSLLKALEGVEQYTDADCRFDKILDLLTEAGEEVD
jgi:hypothetical protein